MPIAMGPPESSVTRWRRIKTALVRWADTSATTATGSDADRIDWLRAAPFIGVHLICICVIWVGVSPTALVVAALSYAVRMFAITGFYHRYFAHRTFRTSRGLQFFFACLGAASTQRGPLWWASHHRNHHQHADTPQDPHSPRLKGFVWSHMGWFLTPAGLRTDWQRIPDWTRFPELGWLDRFDIVVPFVYGTLIWCLGVLLAAVAPGLHTGGWQLLVWGFFVSTVVLFHCTVTINSLAHRFGTRRFATADDSRNNLWLALITFGEGWHNNHHFFPGSARQGFRWWELDMTYYVLRIMALLGLVEALKPVPARVWRAMER
jgi:stearoyl-CoA desaturase (Delta-9 desaturase)